MTIKEYDVIIIGSGAGGAPVANTLVKNNKSVLVIEKGPLFDTQKTDEPSQFYRDEMLAYGPEKRINVDGVDNNGHNYFHSHIEPDINDEPHVYRNKNNEDWATLEGYTAQAVGGGTQLYGGVSLRFTELDFNLKSFNESRQIDADKNGDVKRESRDWPVSYNDFRKYYNKAEEYIGINGQREGQLKDFSSEIDQYQKPLTPNPISDIARQGMLALGKAHKHQNRSVKPYRPPLAIITENHDLSNRKVPSDKESIKTSYVNRYGDPLGFKSNTWVSLLRPISEEDNFSLISNCHVTHLTSDFNKVKTVHYLTPDGREEKVNGKIIVVACSAIESVRLLKISASKNENFNQRIDNNNLLGKYFLTHCFGGASGITTKRFDKSRALDADWATDCCATIDFIQNNRLWAGGAIYNNTSDQALPVSTFRTHWSKDLETVWDGFEDDTGLRNQNIISKIRNDYGKHLSISFMANQVPQRSNCIELHNKVKDKWGLPSAYIIKDWHEHDRQLMKVFSDQCKRVLDWGKENGQIDRIKGAAGVDHSSNPRARIANHILGGARFGEDPNDSVLDPDCRAWQFDNLYVTDGSFMPTSGSANPTLTIQANAFRVADKILARL